MCKMSPPAVRNALNFDSDGKKCAKFCLRWYAGGPQRKKVPGPPDGKAEPEYGTESTDPQKKGPVKNARGGI